MTVAGTVTLRCPACGREHADVALVQSINTRQQPAHKAALLAGDLNVLACGCGKRTRLEATLLYHDPERDYFAQVCPGGEAAMAAGTAAFDAIGPVGTRRLVPSQNALLEKVKLLEAGLDDRVAEVLKVLLLASRGGEEALESVLLFDAVEREAGTIRWLLLDDEQVLHSPLAAYEKLATTLKPTEDLRIDRAWALEAVRAMMANAN